MPTWLLHVIGNIGVLMILGAYFLVSSSMIKSISPWYQSLNLVGAIIMAIYSLVLAAWASVVLNGTWAIIAVVALLVNLRKARAAATSATSAPATTTPA